MTYGENSGVIRDELAALLRHHRIQQRLGGPGIHTVPESTTLAERAQMGGQIRHYRYATLRWCRQALESVRPKTDLPRATTLPRSPVEELCHRLDRSMSAELKGPPLLELLDTQHQFEPVVRWQRVARAATLGEYDFTADVNLGWLTLGQGRAVAKDAADVVRGVVVLDRRYRLVPGWKPIPEVDRLNRAAESLSSLLTIQADDLAVDARGWRRAPGPLSGPMLPGVAGAVQAQHNLLVDLVHFPHALNLRRLLHAQAQVSHEAARHAAAAAPELVDRLLERQSVYRRLVAQSRNVGGVVGDGGLAVGQAQIAISRLQRASAAKPVEGESLHHLQRLFMHTDARIASTIEHGFHEKLYVVSVKGPRIADRPINGVYQTRQRWMPATPATQTDLLPIVREELRPQPIRATQPHGARASRQAYEAALVHRPARHSPPR